MDMYGGNPTVGGYIVGGWWRDARSVRRRLLFYTTHPAASLTTKIKTFVKIFYGYIFFFRTLLYACSTYFCGNISH